MKKILYVITSLDYGGTQKQLYYLLKFLLKERKKDYSFSVVSLKKEGRLKNKFFSLGVDIFDLGLPLHTSFLSLFLLPLAVLKFWLLVIKIKPQIIHSFLFQANIFSRMVKVFLPNCKVICSERVAEKQKLWQGLIYRITNFLVDKIVVNSYELKDFVLRTQGVNENKVVVVPNMIDEEEVRITKSKEEIRDELRVDKNKFLVVSVGRLHKQKGYDLLLEIVRKVKGDNIVFVVVGDGEEAEYLRKKVGEYDIGDCVKFVGYRENVYDYINAADLFLLTSYWEGFPNVVLEAMLLKKMVLSTSVEGVSEILREKCIISLSLPREKIVECFVKKIRSILEKKFIFEGDFELTNFLPVSVVEKILLLY